MNKLPGRKFGAVLSLFAAASLSVPGFAQTTPAQTAPDNTASQTPQVLDKFTVTGSYLPISASVTPSPVVTIQSAQIGMSGMSDPLNLLRQMTPYFAGNGNLGTEVNNGYAGESNVALRNLTTLVLINGQRMTSSPFSNGQLVDLNTIPTAMIDRIDILKDSASTVYGSDAIGGVINVILKKDFNGFEIGGRLGSTSKKDYKTRNIYLIGGVANNGFTLTIGAQHFENTSLLTTDRSLTTMDPKSINALGYNVTSTVYSGSYAGRVNSLLLAGSPLAVGAPGYNAKIVTPPPKTDPNAPGLTAAQLQAAGIYLPISSTPASQAAGGTSILNTTLFGNPLIVDTKRNEFMANAEKELAGKNLVAFGDFLYSQTTNGGSGLAPSPIAGVGPGGGNTLSIPANNPYNLFGVVIGVGQAPGAPTARTRLEEIGKRYSRNETNTWRFVGGLKGAITEKYSWEATYAYSRASLLQQIAGGANGANMNLAMQPLLNAAGTAYVYDASGRPLSQLTDASGNNLPVYDFFALPGYNDPRTIDKIRTTLFQSGVTTLRDIGVRVRGTPFELPAGDLSFAAGIETRREDLTSAVDGLFANGLALGYNPANTFGGGTRSTKGAFIEFGVPLVSAKMGVPLVHVLELTLADRQEKIEPGGNANTPKVGVRWLPFDDQFALRGTYAKGFIAPSIYNLFGPSQGNSPSFTLPVGDGRSGSGGSSPTEKITIQGTSVELSNPYLQASHSKSYTAGIVFSPKAIKGLTFTADYYWISQDKVGSIDYTAIVADLNAKGSGSVYAQDPLHLGTGFVFADGTTLASTAPNQVNHTNFGQVTVARNPQGDQKTDGLDISIDYRLTTDNIGVFNFGVNANFLFNYWFRATAADPYLQYARVMTDSTIGGAGYEGLLPSYQINPYVNYSYKSWSASMFMRYIPATTVPGTLFGNPDPTATNDYTLNGKASKTPNYFVADLSVSYTVPDFGHNSLRNLTITAGANNVFNHMAPYVPGDGSFVAENNTVKNAYDIVGRFYFVELKKKF